MNFLKKFRNVLPENIKWEDVRKLQPDSIWEQTPQMAAAHALALSGKFDARDYLARYPDVADENMDPIQHYVFFGFAEGRFFRTPQADALARPIPKVSILVPVYNNACYLRECLRSLLRQTMPELEFIVLNDGSTDPAACQILKEYALTDSRVILINKKNTGYGHTMTVGLSRATGKYVGILESDDYVDADYYEKLYATAEEFKADFVKSNFTTFTGNGEARKHKSWTMIGPELTNRLLDSSVPPARFYSNGFLGTPFGIYSRKFLVGNKIGWSQTPGASFQDTGFWFKTHAYVRRMYFKEECGYHCRRDNEHSSVNDPEKIFSVCHELMVIKRIIQSDPDKARFNDLFQNMLVHVYKWNLNRIHADVMPLFEERFRADWIELSMCPKYNPKLLSNADSDYLARILKSGPAKIACIYTASLSNGGLEKAACDLSHILKNHGYSVFFILAYPNHITYDFQGQIFNTDLKNEKLRDILDKADVIFDFKFKSLERNDHIVQYCLSRHAHKYIPTVHTQDDRCEYYINEIGRTFGGDLSRTPAIICVSEKVKKSVEKRYGKFDNLRVIYNSLDLGEIDRANWLAQKPRLNDYILFAGRLDAAQVKGLDVLIPAFLNSRAAKSVDLVLAGAGALDENILQYIKKHPQGKHIHFAGFQDLFASGLLKNARFLISPSRQEGFSLVRMESLASGTPVLATDTGGCSEIIREGVNGSFIRELGVEKLSLDIDRMMESAEAMRAACRDSIRHLDREEIGRQIIGLIEKEIKGRRPELAQKPHGPRISVVIPVYNSEAWLEQCLKSVTGQTLRELEIICVDDGSTDKSAQIIKNFPDRRIKYYRQENAGSGKARNLGISKASGEFVAFLDSDDILPDKNSYEILLRAARENGTRIAGGNLAYLTPLGKVENNKNNVNLFLQEAVINYSKWQYDYGYYMFIYQRQFLLENNMQFPDYLRYQDPVFFARAMQKAEKFAVVPVISYGYRTRVNRKDWKWSVRQASDCMNACSDNLVFARENHLNELYKYTVAHANDFFEFIKSNAHASEARKAISRYNSLIRQYSGTQLNNLYTTLEP